MLKKGLIYGFFVVSWILFGGLLICVVFQNRYFSYAWYVVLPLAFAWLGILFALFRLCQKYKQWLLQNHKKALFFFFCFLSLTQVLFYVLCASYPTQDFERVFTGAYNYTIAGEILDPYLDYFYKFPNNLSITVLLQFLFRLCYRFGITDFFIVGAVFNGICVQLAYVFVYLIAAKLAGRQIGFFSLLALYLCLPLQTYISIFYTDTTTMLYPLAVVYFSLVALQSGNRKKQMVSLALLSLLAAVGSWIKYSVVIAFIAVLLVFLLNGAFKQALACVLGFAFCFLLLNAGTQAFVYENILDESIAADRATPFTAWIAMGMQGDGAHSAAENEYIWSFETQEEKKQAALDLLQERLEERNALEHLSFLSQKAVRSFGSGNLDYPSTVSGAPMTQNFMIDILNPAGAYNEVYDNVIQGYHVAVMFLLVLGFALSLYYGEQQFLPMQIASFGIFMFLLLWEAGTRYLLHYYPMFILSGAVLVASMLDRKPKRTLLRKKHK